MDAMSSSDTIVVERGDKPEWVFVKVTDSYYIRKVGIVTYVIKLFPFHLQTPIRVMQQLGDQQFIDVGRRIGATAVVFEHGRYEFK